MRVIRWCRRLFPWLLLFTLPVWAQFDAGSIAGTVVDPSGALVPTATVTLRDANTGQIQTLKANSVGRFAAPALPPGGYLVTATAKGFGVASSHAVNVTVGAHLSLVLHLPLKSQPEMTVTVTGSATTVQTDSSAQSVTLDDKQVSNLPTNGRDVMSLLTLSPGSVQTGGFGQTSVNGVETSLSGLNTLLDGADATRVDVNATSLNNGNQESRVTRSSVDSVAEVEVLQNNYSAEYGRAIGTIMNIVTRSGGNDTHGEVFDFLRNDALNARNFFEYTPKKQPYKLNQFGGNLGGAIIKNKLFYFVNYEGVRQHITNSFVAQTLSAQERAKFVASMAPYVAALAPLPANAQAVPGSNGTLDFYNASQLNQLREDTGSVKIDWNRTDGDRWMFRYNIDDSFTGNPFGINAGQINDIPARNQFMRLDDTRVITPTLINEGGIAINRTVTDDQSGGNGLPIFSNFANVGQEPGQSLFSQYAPSNSYQFIDGLSWIHGNHVFKFGEDIRMMRVNRELRTQDIFTYGSLSDLENNRAFALKRLGYPMSGIRGGNYDFYAQDDWKVSPRLTLNLGLRYEYNTVLHFVNHNVQNFDYATQTLLPGDAPLYKGDPWGFAPRLGFSYDPFGTGRTVIRSGFGLFYLPQLAGTEIGLAGNSYPNPQITIFQDATLAFPAPAQFPPTAGAVQSVEAVDPHEPNTYAEQWSFDVQHELLRGTVLDVDYTGNHGVHLQSGGAYAPLELNNPDITTGIAPHPQWGTEAFVGNFLSSKYNALEVGLHRRGPLTLDANYTWSHELDNAVNVFGAYENSNDINADYASGDIDVRQVFTADGIYNLPQLHVSNGLLRGVANGWQVSSVLQLRSGLPVNVVLTPGVFIENPLRPDAVSGASIQAARYSLPMSQLNPAAYTVPPANALEGTLQRNAARGPGFAQMDFSGMKNFRMGERFTWQFRADLFNILNHPNFSNPDNALCQSVSYPAGGGPGVCMPNPTFGQSFSTVGNLVGTGTSRQVQFALKLMF